MRNRSEFPSAECPNQALKDQTTTDRYLKTYTVTCGCCHGTITVKKKWYERTDTVIKRLRLNLDYCHFCQHWICGDCFLVDDGYGGISICRKCANKKGISGYTSAEFKAFASKQKD